MNKIKYLFAVLPCLLIFFVALNVSQDVVTLPLFNKTDPVDELIASNFDSLVFQPGKAYFVAFYLSTCPVCVKLKPHYVQLGYVVKHWKSVIGFGAYNCRVPGNVAKVCIPPKRPPRSVLPFFAYYSPGAKDIINDAKWELQLNLSGDYGDIKRSIITNILSDSSKFSSWNFDYLPKMQSEITIQSLPPKTEFVLIAVEKDSDTFWGAEVMLHFSSCKSLYVRRAKLSAVENVIKDKHLPIIMILKVIKDSQLEKPVEIRIVDFNYADVYKLVKTCNLVDERVNPCPSYEPPSDKIKEMYRVSEIDLLISVYNAFNQIGIFMETFPIDGSRFDALYVFVKSLAKYYGKSDKMLQTMSELKIDVPKQSKANRDVSLFFRTLENKLSNLREIKGIWMKEYLENEKAFEIFFGDEKNPVWKNCAGIYYGCRASYSCGMWQNFHVLTVNAYLEEYSTENFDHSDLQNNLANFIDNFIFCTECQKFTKEKISAYPNNNLKREKVVNNFWSLHNDFNRNVSKSRFPIKGLCDDCSNEKVDDNTFRFLLKYYTDVDPYGSLIAGSSSIRLSFITTKIIFLLFLRFII